MLEHVSTSFGLHINILCTMKTSFHLIVACPKFWNPSDCQKLWPIDDIITGVTRVSVELMNVLISFSEQFSTSKLTLDLLQFPYKPDRSTHDATAFLLQMTLSHVDAGKGIFLRELFFFNYSSAFNTIVPSRLVSKLAWTRSPLTTPHTCFTPMTVKPPQTAASS